MGEGSEAQCVSTHKSGIFSVCKNFEGLWCFKVDVRSSGQTNTYRKTM